MSTALAPKTNTALATVDLAKKFLSDANTQAEIGRGLSKHMTADRMCRLALTAAQKNPKLLECFVTPQGKRSIALAMLTAGQIGLEPDGRHAHLVPFKNKGGYMECVLMADYKGLIHLAFNHPKVLSVWAEEVRRNDRFVYSRGSNPHIEHEIPLEVDRGDLIGAYACCELAGSKNPVFVVLGQADIDRIKSSSRGADDSNSPWNTAPGEMWKKSAVRQLSKVIPQSAELTKALSSEDEFESTGRSSVTIDVQAQPEVRFKKAIADVAQSTPEPAALAEPDTAPAPVAEPEAATAESQPKPAVKHRGKKSDAVTEPVPENPPSEPTPEPTEKSRADEISEFYQKDAGADFAQVVATMSRLKKSTWGNITAKAYHELPEGQQNELWNGRYGIARQVKSDISTPKA